MGRNSKAKRDARKKRQSRVAASTAPPFIYVSDDIFAEDPTDPPEVRDWVKDRGTPETYLRWAVGCLAAWDGNEDDEWPDVARTMMLEYLSRDTDERPLTDAEIDDMQKWTQEQCADFARRAVAAGRDGSTLV